MNKRFLAVSMSSALLFAFGCDNPDKKDDTGEEIQEAVGATGHAVERGAEKAARAVESGVREIGEGLEQVDEHAERAGENIERGAERAGENIESGAERSAAELREEGRELDRAAGSIEEDLDRREAPTPRGD